MRPPASIATRLVEAFVHGEDIRYQPVDAREPVDVRDVADRLVALAIGEPAGLVPDIGGPHGFPMEDLIGSYARDRAVGQRTWEAYPAEKLVPKSWGLNEG